MIVAALLVLALLTFPDYSISNDEEVQHRYGELIVAYYASGFVDRSLFEFGNLHLYGGLFDIVAVQLAKLLPADVFAIRHVLCAVTGVAGIAATAACARLIAGPRAGAVAALALSLCGPWYGAMFNHTKDIPFAAAMIGASYFLLRAARDLPRPRLFDLLLFGLLTGAALGQRAMGLLICLYALLAIALHVPRPFSFAVAARFFGRTLVLFVPSFALAYLVMISAWPWAATGLFNPIRALFAFAHFTYPIKTLLFGDVYLMAQAPRSYVPVYLAIKLPLVVLFGAALAPLMVAVGRSDPFDRQPARDTTFMAATAVLPVILQVIGHGPAFTGMRHFTYVVPPLAVLAGIGFDRALDWLSTRRRLPAQAAGAALGLWLAITASTLVRLHPYQYLYFNELVGGLAGAAQRYDTDYWVNVMHEAVVRLEDMLDREGKARGEFLVAVCGERLSFEHEAARRNRLRWAIGDDPADFFIAPTHMGCHDAVGGMIVIRIERMGTLIGVVKDRRALTRPKVAGAHPEP
jgi:hypothetical protein